MVLGVLYYFLAQRCRAAANDRLQELVYGKKNLFKFECFHCGEVCDPDVMWWSNDLWRTLQDQLGWRKGVGRGGAKCRACVYASQCKHSDGGIRAPLQGNSRKLCPP